MPDPADDRNDPSFAREERAQDPAAHAGAIDVSPVREPSVAREERQASLAALRESALRLAGVLPHPTLPARERPRLWLRPGDQRVVAALVALAALLMGLHWVRLSDRGRAPVEIDAFAPREYLYRIDVNRATWVEWAQLDGIGETLARRIVEDRERNGPFASVDDVQRVRGIGRVRMEAMRPHLRHAGSSPGP